jgi:molecular chaperone GrpE
MQNYPSLVEKLKKAHEQLNQFSIGLIKLKQDFEEFLPHLENIRQITEDEKRSYLSAYDRLTLRLIEILDDLNSQNLKGVDIDTNFEEFIKARLEDTLRRENVMSFKVELGDLFNPEKHEVVNRIINNEKPDGTIVRILKPGYIRNPKIIRRAEVVITHKEVDEV